MKHLNHVDGLRALAIIPVLLAHAGLPGVEGGYVGVDIFFVISGFLISRIILTELTEERFSIRRFYERRARRILPALFVVLGVSFCAATVLLFPIDFDRFAKSAGATTLFASNVYFMGVSGYFEAPHTKPLLHTWSLGVEEQFYVVFPLLLIGIHRYARRWMTQILLVAAIGSIIASEYAVRRYPAFAFFSTPTRFWELLAGTFLAMGVLPTISSRAAREALSFLGAALILWAVFTFSPATRFPGLNAIIPVVGASLLIHAAQGTNIGAILSIRPVVFIGLISYSLYLWHWPIIVFSLYYGGLLERLSGVGVGAVVVFSIALATLSWRYVEQPFRRGSFSQRQIFTAAAAGSFVFLGASAVGGSLDGWSNRFDPEVLRLAAFTRDYSPRRRECHSSPEHPKAAADACVYGAAMPPRYAIWGDSHAVELAFALGELSAERGESIVHFSGSFCPPSLGFSPDTRPACPQWNEDVLHSITSRASVQTVFLIARYFDYERFGQFHAGFAKAADALLAAGRRVVLIYPVPNAKGSVPYSLARYQVSGFDPGDLKIRHEDYLSTNSTAIAWLDNLAASGIDRIHPDALLCQPDCAVYVNRGALYFDSHHLSVAGARFLLPDFVSQFSESPGRLAGRPKPVSTANQPGYYAPKPRKVSK